MKRLEKLLVALNMEEENHPCLKTLKSFSQHFKSKVILLYVVEYSLKTDPTPGELVHRGSEKIKKLRQELIDNGVEVEDTIVEIGEPHKEIVDIATENNVSGIVMDGSGKSVVERIFIGSTMEKVIQSSVKPVLSVRTGKEESFNKIMVPVDFSVSSSRAMDNAIKMARIYQSKIEVIHILDDIPSSIFTGVEERNKAIQEKEEEAKEQMENFLKPFELSNIEYNTSFLIGKPASEIVEQAREKNVDLIIMGSRGESVFHAFFLGSVATKVLRSAMCSVLLVKEEDLMKVNMHKEIEDIHIMYNQGKELQAHGYYEEALETYKEVVNKDRYFAHAWERMAEVYDKLNNTEKAEECRMNAKMIQEWLWNQRIEAEIKGKNILYKKNKRNVVD